MGIFLSDQGTEKMNGLFKAILENMEFSTKLNGWIPSSNGVVERKNWHLLEVAQSIMFIMNVPKVHWGDAILSVAYVIDHLLLKTLDLKVPIDLLQGKFSLRKSLVVFFCSCIFRKTKSKLDARAQRCVFVGYSATQKAYKCHYPLVQDQYSVNQPICNPGMKNLSRSIKK